MENIMQFRSQSVFMHGVSVHEHYKTILKILEGNEYNMFLLPDSLFSWYEKHSSSLFNITVMEKYHLYHDCGKPLCLTYDEFNKPHFYNHENISAEQYKILFPDDNIIYTLIKNDMYFHRKVENTIQLEKVYKINLYITAWAELISNSKMFCGFESESFKIKCKNLVKRMREFK